MGRDVSAEVAPLIGESKVYGSSENIRHGKYKFLITRCFSDEIETDKGKHRMSFVLVVPLTSEPNPQTEGDHVDYPGTAGPLKDDGRNPNVVGSNCALKVDHDGPGAMMAGTNIKAFILGLFNKQDLTSDETNKTWIDLARRKPCKKGDIVDFNKETNQPILADKDKSANPACGMVINCTTIPRKKKTVNEKGAYVTKLIWSCAAPIGTGENAPDLVQKRRIEIEATQVNDDDEEEVTPQMVSINGAGNGEVAPPPPAQGVYMPPSPWTQHTDKKYWGTTPETQWFWNPTTNAVKSRAQLKTSGGV